MHLFAEKKKKYFEIEYTADKDGTNMHDLYIGHAQTHAHLCWSRSNDVISYFEVKYLGIT
jgi:hypothetical protein